MESKFAHLSQRDNSVSMLRLKMSRRRSQTQKENRERTLNTRRQLEKLTELDASSVEASVAMTTTSVIHERTLSGTALAKKAAVEERLKQLERWKERKALEKEKEKREKERKGVFKTGIYHPKDRLVVFSLPQAPAASSTGKELKEHTVPSHNTRVTRSMKQQLQMPLKMQEPNTMAMKGAQPVQRLTRTHAAAGKSASVQTKAKTAEPLLTRSANRPPVTKKPAANVKPKDKPAEMRSTRSRATVNVVAPNSVTQKDHKEAANSIPAAAPAEPEKRPRPPNPLPPSEPDPGVLDQPQADSVPAGDAAEAPSFAPEGFTFQAPAGLKAYRFEPLTPRSADAFLTPTLSFSLPPAPVLDFGAEDVPNHPVQPKTPLCSPPVEAPPSPACATEDQHDVPYFRAEIAGETDRLTSLCVHWEAKVEDDSIPEEMRDRMRTAVGQARLLMKERFKQFSGLVDDCEFARGEKITTCTDLQGFWDMVYYQVEDVNRKFDALKDAESLAWVEERKPPPRPKRLVKKPSAAPVKPTGSKAAAKSRLAAVKAAMKAKQQAAENVHLSAGEAQAECQPAEPVVFDGGFFQVESPARPPASLRRSSRLSAVQPPASPCCFSPRRPVTRRFLALTPDLAAPSQCSPGQAPKSVHGTPPSSQRKHSVKASPGFTPGGCGPEPDSECIVTNVPVAEERTAEAADVVPPSVCETLPDVCPGAEPAHLGFTLSPCASGSQASTPHQLPAEAENTSAVEEIPGLDFERYLQPTQRCSLSPRETVTIEMLSPTAADVEMESPKAQSEDLLSQHKPALPAVSSLAILHSPQTVDSALLLFTPNPKDRIRQSVCQNDLMVFTPPL